MHKLIDYLCEQLDELEDKVGSGAKLSMAEMEYGDTLAHFKKNLMKAEEMGGGSYDSSYDSNGGYSRRRNYAGDDRYSREDGSYARGRGARRDSMGRYSRNGYSMAGGAEMAESLRELAQDAPNEHIKQKLQALIHEVEKM